MEAMASGAEVAGRAQLGIEELVEPVRLVVVVESRKGGREEELVRVETCRDDTDLFVNEVAVRELDEREPCM